MIVLDFNRLYEIYDDIATTKHGGSADRPVIGIRIWHSLIARSIPTWLYANCSLGIALYKTTGSLLTGNLKEETCCITWQPRSCKTAIPVMQEKEAVSTEFEGRLLERDPPRRRPVTTITIYEDTPFSVNNTITNEHTTRNLDQSLLLNGVNCFVCMFMQVYMMETSKFT